MHNISVNIIYNIEHLLTIKQCLHFNFWIRSSWAQGSHMFISRITLLILVC